MVLPGRDFVSAENPTTDGRTPSRRGFKDHYLAVPFDISKALFIATANDLNSIPRPLLDRMEVIQLPSYSMDEKIAIARDHLVPKMELQHGLRIGSVSITDAGLRTMIREYTQEAGVRTLERQVAAVCRHVVLTQATSAQESATQDFVDNNKSRGRGRPFIVTRALLPEILGPCSFAPTSLHVGNNATTLPVRSFSFFFGGRVDVCLCHPFPSLPFPASSFFYLASFRCGLSALPAATTSLLLNCCLGQVAGVALGLAWTPFGGELLTIETAKMAGSGRLILTGRLGETMRESAQIALGWIRSHAALLGLHGESTGIDDGDDDGDGASWGATAAPSKRKARKNLLDGMDVHVHFPAGAIQKDGPSAGVAMTAALVSLFSNRPLPANIAMTGEISLSGAVLPVGGIKEKVIAAHAAGCQGVIVPHRNGADLVDVPASTQSALEVLTAERIEDVLEGLFGQLPLSHSNYSGVSVEAQKEKSDVSQLSGPAEEPLTSSNEDDPRASGVAHCADGARRPSNPAGQWVPQPSATASSVSLDTVCLIARSSL